VRERLDTLLVARGLFDSRAQARGAVLAGEVTVDGAVVDKPGSQIAPDAVLALAARRRYVSRGGDKLDHAMAALGVDVAGEDAIDLGSSTGGFVERLLEGGAARVVAVDVGYGQLDWGLRQDPRVIVMERTNARELTPDRLPFAPSFVTADVSFISLTTALGPVLECLRSGYRGLALVKPQFEAGRGHVGKGGVVRDQSVHTEVLARVGAWLEERGAAVLGMNDSGHPGPKGNREYFVYFRDGREATGRSTAAAISPAAGSAAAPGPVDPAEAARRAVEAAHRATDTPAGPQAAVGEGPKAAVGAGPKSAGGEGPQAAAGDAPEAPDA
jgi:23S rRNA (cytidine1920-2'-O)/16S rRNA (cytidine1409-2'-O)-methyltransferase